LKTLSSLRQTLISVWLAYTLVWPVQDRDNPGFVLHVADRRDRMASGSADLIGDDRECLGRAPRHRDRKALPCKAPGRGSAQSSARADANDSGNGFVYGHSINHCLVPKP
jgi:hypothetical protein